MTAGPTAHTLRGMRSKSPLPLLLLLAACGGPEREPSPRLIGQPSSGVGITTAVLDFITGWN